LEYVYCGGFSERYFELFIDCTIVAPVKDAVSYKTVKFDEYFENRSPYTPQTPTKELDEMWEDLYNCQYHPIICLEFFDLN
jgi:hypothetical protein